MSGSDRILTFCSLLSVTNVGERSCSLAAGRGAEPSLPGTGQVLLCASLSAQLVAVRHRAVAAAPQNVTSMIWPVGGHGAGAGTRSPSTPKR